jgi:hypothetical protein
MKWIIGLLMVFVFSCKNQNPSEKKIEESMTFHLDSLIRETCLGEDCARLRLVFPRAEGGSNATRINESIQDQLLEFLQVEENSWSSLDSAVTGFLHSFEKFNEEFPDSFGAWEIEVKGVLSYESDSTVSVFFEHYSYLGGAHPNSSVAFLNFDKKTGDYLQSDQLIRDETRLRLLAEQQFRLVHLVEKGKSLLDDSRFFIPETGFFLANAMGFNEGEFWVIYVPYEIGPYVLGYTELRFTKEELGDVVRW